MAPFYIGPDSGRARGTGAAGPRGARVERAAAVAYSGSGARIVAGWAGYQNDTDSAHGLLFEAGLGMRF